MSAFCGDGTGANAASMLVQLNPNGYQTAAEAVDGGEGDVADAGSAAETLVEAA